MSLRAVFLDVGNTLLHERPSRFAIYQEVAERHGAEVTVEGMLGLMRAAHEDLPEEVQGGYRFSDPWFTAYIRRIFHEQLGLPERDVVGITDELFARFEDPRTFRLFPGAVELIDGLRGAGLLVGVISNWSARLPRVLAGLELDSRLDVVLCSAIERMEKPDPAIFAAALERTGVAAEEALHAGDHPERDGYGALRAGLSAVLVDHRGGVDPKHAVGLPIVRSLAELGEHIQSVT